MRGGLIEAVARAIHAWDLSTHLDVFGAVPPSREWTALDEQDRRHYNGAAAISTISAHQALSSNPNADQAEAVARALHGWDVQTHGPERGYPVRDLRWEALSDAGRELYRNEARAALVVLRSFSGGL